LGAKAPFFVEYIMKLFELFNKSLPWTVDAGRPGFIVYNFNVENVGSYQVFIVNSYDHRDSETWEIDFVVSTSNGGISHDIIDTGGRQVQVFSTVVDIVKHFLSTYGNNADKVIFSAKEPSRVKLYRRFAKMLGDYTEDHQTYFGGEEHNTEFVVDLKK